MSFIYDHTEDDDDVSSTMKKTKIYFSTDLRTEKILFIPSNWSIDDILYHGNDRLQLFPKAKYIYNNNGDLVHDPYVIDNGDQLFFCIEQRFTLPPKTDDVKYIGSYKVLKLLGRGGFGRVYLAENITSRDKVALKFLPKKDMYDIKMAELVTTEMHALFSMDHPNILKFYHVLDINDSIIFVLEYAEGGDLQQYLKKQANHKLSDNTARIYFLQILNGLIYAHNMKLCHRDLKLANILMRDIQEIMIGDFGLSSFFVPGKDFKSKCGSLYYLAPEVFLDLPSEGPPLDIWSLGVILYIILTGKFPFDGTDVKKNIINGNIRIDDGISFEVRDLIHGLLDVNTKTRYTTNQILSHPWLTRASPIHYNPGIDGKYRDIQFPSLNIQMPRASELLSPSFSPLSSPNISAYNLSQFPSLASHTSLHGNSRPSCNRKPPSSSVSTASQKSKHDWSGGVQPTKFTSYTLERLMKPTVSRSKKCVSTNIRIRAKTPPIFLPQGISDDKKGY